MGVSVRSRLKEYIYAYDWRSVLASAEVFTPLSSKCRCTADMILTCLAPHPPLPETRDAHHRETDCHGKRRIADRQVDDVVV
jgi:hypothetical protein